MCIETAEGIELVDGSSGGAADRSLRRVRAQRAGDRRATSGPASAITATPRSTSPSARSAVSRARCGSPGAFDAGRAEATLRDGELRVVCPASTSAAAPRSASPCGSTDVRILFVGDIFGKPGREIARRAIPALVERESIDFVIANVENSAAGFGVTGDIADTILGYGVDVMTTGNHVWDKKEVLDYIPRQPKLLRPANFPAGIAGPRQLSSARRAPASRSASST